MNELEELGMNHDMEHTIAVKNERQKDIEMYERYYDREKATENVLEKVTGTLNQNLENEMAKKTSALQNIDKDMVKNVAKTVAEMAIKLVLKKKLNVNFSTFDEAKKAIESAMDGNTKDAVKSASDAALNQMKGIDASTKSVIKSIKNSVITNTIDSSKYDITVSQTKVLNRLHKNCDAFEKALNENDAANIKKKANAIQKDMKVILPIQETICEAQKALDQYELWKNKGNRSLTEEEKELIDKFYQSA